MTTGEKKEKLLAFALHQLKDIILPWWMENMPDDKNGGFLGGRDHFNHPESESPKGLILNARILWAFSAVYRLDPRREYLEMAGRAYRYIIAFFRDPDYPGYFWSLNPDGTLLNGKKQIYAHAFVMYAMTEYHAASGPEEALQEAANLYELIEARAFDREKNGYFEAFSREWEETGDLRLSSIDLNEKKTMNTHLHVIEAYSRLLRHKKNERLKGSVDNLLGIFSTRIINADSGHLNLFFDEDWNLRSGDVSFGHDIEASWLLQEAAESTGDKQNIKKFRSLAQLISSAAVPAIVPGGGIIHEYHEDTSKNTGEREWWAQAEGVVGFLNLYRNTGDEIFLDRALDLAGYIENHFVDRINGEWFYRVDKSGKPVTSYEKAGFWKCPYHTVRMCTEILERLGR